MLWKLLIFCSLISFAQASEIRIATNDIVYNQLFKKIEPEFTKTTGVKIKYVFDVSGGGKASSAIDILRAVAKGDADAGASAFTIDDWKKAAEKEADLKPIVDKITYRLVGSDKLGIMAHKSVKVSSLTLEELGGIFTGKIKNWSEVKGPDVPIVPVKQLNTIAREKFFRKVAMGDQDFSSSTKPAATYDELYGMLEKIPGSVTFLPEFYIIERGANHIKTPEMGRPINMVNIGKPSEDLFKLINFIKK